MCDSAAGKILKCIGSINMWHSLCFTTVVALGLKNSIKMVVALTFQSIINSLSG